MPKQFLPHPREFARRLSPLLLAIALAAAGLSGRAQAEALTNCSAASVEDALRQINEARARGAVCRRSGEVATAAPVQWSERLAAVALMQAREQAALNRMGHRDTQNRGLGERLRLLGYRFGSAVENVAVGYPAAADVFGAWLESEGHCENLMNTKVVEFGLACHDGANADSPGEGRYWALVLSSPPRSTLH